MIARSKLTAGRISESAETPELDVTPVMNMFIILIPFLVSMAAFTHLAVLKVALPPNLNAGMANSQEKPKVKMTIVVAPDFLVVTSGEVVLDSLPREGGDYNLDEFERRLARLRTQADNQEEAIVAVRDAVRFKHVVSVMDRCKGAGFSKVGLSTATQDAGKGV